MMEELNTLFDDHQCLTIDGIQLDLKPLTIGQLPRLTEALEGFNFPGEILKLDPVVDGGRWITALMFDLAKDADRWINVASIMSGKPEDWVRGLAMDSFVILVEALVELNALFFANRLAPVLNRVMARLNSVMAGQMPFPGSSDTDIP